MCCHRRCCPQSRAPIVATLGKMAYNKYQSFKAEKRARSLSDPNNLTISHANLSDDANSEILEKFSIDPPSYEQLVVNRSIVPPEPEVIIDEKTACVEVGNGEDRDDSLEMESFREVSNGMTYTSQEIPAASNAFVESLKSEKETKRAGWKSKWVQRKSEKAARKAANKASA